MKRIGLIAIVLLLIWIVCRPVAPVLRLPPAVHSAWVEPLATLGTPYLGTIELPLRGEDPYHLVYDIKPVFKANDQKRRLYATLHSGKGKMGLFRKYSTMGSRQIFEWLLVQDGKLTYVLGQSRDGGASLYSIYTPTPREFKLGFLRENAFVEGEPSSADSPIMVFNFEVPNAWMPQQLDNTYFY